MVLLESYNRLGISRNIKNITFSVPSYYTNYERTCFLDSIKLAQIKDTTIIDESQAS